MTDFNLNLRSAHDLILSLLSHIHSFPHERLLYHAPVLDRIYLSNAGNGDPVEQKKRVWRQDEVTGLRKFVEQVEQHERLIKSTLVYRLKKTLCPQSRVWKLFGRLWSVASLQYPSKGFEYRKQKEKSGKQAKKDKDVWVDVIAKGGQEWIRIYSKKISHLLAEFREADSYINSDFDSESDDQNTRYTNTNSLMRPCMSNSLFTTARELLSASQTAPRIPGASVPSLTMWLTRIPPTAADLSVEYLNTEDLSPKWPDDRIPMTIDALREMGIRIEFLSPSSLQNLCGHPLPTPLPPSLKMNFDITTLLGICSDVLHYPIPRDKLEAAKRSLRPKDQLVGKGSEARGRDGMGKCKGKGRKEMNGDQTEDDLLKGQSQNSRELYKCILEEMQRPWVEEFNSVMQQAWKDHKEYHGVTSIEEDEPRLEFWATRQAAQYTYEALTSGPAHGLGAEQRRMKRMLGHEEGDFFEDSRYKGKEGILKGFRIRVFDEEDVQCEEVEKTGFHKSLASLTQLFLDEYYASGMSFPIDKKTKNKQKPASLPNFLQPKKIPTPPIARLSLPFPVVSLHSLCRGAKEGMTTVMMGTATFKEVWGQSRWKVRGWERASYNFQLNHEGGVARRERGNAAIMIFPYRVFGEGKRVRFGQGDYSYPNKEEDGREDGE
ncbi:uncharacterized protein L203_100049 [Cryptococcus depauperatus CBS 7841]|uniref:Uncharacterized protein n=1 Tax=Cryptococcus depauperatus CBS 7841 TaxID=1295531 RepID=A0AAJ8LX16_9TREE